ncbi:hypothetical protein AAC387_Pa02g2474 [Persea americana]
MPRPGPRPYECVRRAWHSDRHQPMRGSVIQEIFRLVNEIHSPDTRKNKEWQEKLPVVVLKAEEIMYSKANSEAEYSDLKTIWERANDAVNTIIRRDENTESGDFLQPCIEAALNLGCTPRRASRSQRHNPRFYLNSTRQEACETSVAPKISDNPIYRGPSHVLPSPLGSQVPSPNLQNALNYSIQSAPTMLTTCLGSDSVRPALQGKCRPHEQVNLQPISCREFPRYFENFAISCRENPNLQMATYPLPSSGRSYPLYYSSSHNIVEPNYPFQHPQESNCDRLIVCGPPVLPIVEAKTGFLQNVHGCKNTLDASNRTTQGYSNLGGTSETLLDRGYDLSLRLGPPPVPCLNRESSSILADAVSSSSHDGRRFCDLSPHRVIASHFECSSSSHRDEEFCFFPSNDSDNTSETHLRRWSSAGENLNIENPIRKRKAPINSSFEDEHCFWWPKPSQNQLFDRTRGPSS